MRSMSITKIEEVRFSLLSCQLEYDDQLVQKIFTQVKAIGCLPFLIPCWERPANGWGDMRFYETPSIPIVAALLEVISRMIEHGDHPDYIKVMICDTPEQLNRCQMFLNFTY